MSNGPIVRLLEHTWRDYLEQRAHRLVTSESRPGLIQSRNAKRARYRWVLLASDRPTHKLARPDAAAIRQHLREARRRGERCYLVVGFPDEPGKIVVVPAASALRAGLIRSNVGGIEWTD
jgi:hypothetical protein